MRHTVGVGARALVIVAVAVFGSVAAVSAQSVIGPVSWQLQPYCNVVTMTLYAGPAGFTLEGTDDLCGASNKGSAVGVASPNAAGDYTLNFTVVMAPSGKPVHVSALISPATGSGTWSDSVGNSGTFAFFGSTAGLPARPMPTSGLSPASVTASDIAPGAITAVSINTSQVQARVSGTCPAGQAMTRVNSNGTVTCAAASTNVRFRAEDATTQSITGAAAVLWGAQVYNVGSGVYTPAAGTYVVPSSGTYMVTASIRFEPLASPSGYYCLALAIGGAEVQFTCAAQTASQFEVPIVSTVRELTAGAVLSIRAFNSTGASQTISGIASTSEFTVTRLQ